MEVSLRSPNGGIRLRVTERGLPMALKLEQPELSKAPTHLAHEILLLCQLGARRAQVARRRDLVARGDTPAVIHSLNLSTEEESGTRRPNCSARTRMSRLIPGWSLYERWTRRFGDRAHRHATRPDVGDG